MDFIFVWLMSFVLGFWIFKKIKEWQAQPPGPWGMPIVGYLPFINAEQPHITLVELAQKFGPIYTIKMGNVNTVVLSDHKLVREAFAKECFNARAPLYLTHGIMNKKGIICAEGSLWKDQRKLITSWLRSFGMSKHGVTKENLERRIATGALDLLQDIVSSEDQSAIDLSYLATEHMGNVVNEIIFGYKFPKDDETWQWLRQIQEEAVHDMGVAGVVNFLPFVRYLVPSFGKAFEVIVRGQAQTHRLYASIIERRRRELGITRPKEAAFAPHQNIFNEHPKGYIKCVKYSKNTSETIEHHFDPEGLIASNDECIVDNFLREQKKRFDENDPLACCMTDEQMYYLLADIFGAGLDTTSLTLEWFFLFMVLHPEQQELVRDELLALYPEDTNDVDYNKLPRLMANICESQRLRTIVPIGVPHGAVEEAYIGDYRIPKNTMVVALLWKLHMDPEVWEEPDEFNPDRFLSPDGKLLKPQEFIPFQTGKRMCPGEELSRMISAGFVAKLFRRWRLKLASPPPTLEEMKGIVGLTLAPPRVLYHCEPL